MADATAPQWACAVPIGPMTSKHWPEVSRIYAEGIEGRCYSDRWPADGGTS